MILLKFLKTIDKQIPVKIFGRVPTAILLTIATAFKVIDTCNGTAPVSHVGAKQVYSEKAFDLDPDQRQVKLQIELSEQDAKVLLDQARIRCEQDLRKLSCRFAKIMLVFLGDEQASST